MNLADRNDIRDILNSEGFSFKKSLGQNFIIDSNVCPAMAESCCDENTGVIEIGPGAGVLTAELCKRAKKVVAVELDERLRPVLSKTLAGFDNFEVIFADVMKIDLKKLISEHFNDCGDVAVCANLPYYITSPILMMLLESRLPIRSITAMVQKEAAERLCADLGCRAAGAVTAVVEYYSNASVLFEVPRESFLPSPKVDSAVIQLILRDKPPITVSDEAKFFRIVKSCFAQRRKTLLNTVGNTLGIDREVLRGAITDIGLDPSVRGEQLSMEQLAALAERIGDLVG